MKYAKCVCRTCVCRVHLTLKAVNGLCCQCYQFSIRHFGFRSKSLRASYVYYYFLLLFFLYWCVRTGVDKWDGITWAGNLLKRLINTLYQNAFTGNFFFSISRIGMISQKKNIIHLTIHFFVFAANKKCKWKRQNRKPIWRFQMQTFSQKKCFWIRLLYTLFHIKSEWECVGFCSHEFSHQLLLLFGMKVFWLQLKFISFSRHYSSLAIVMLRSRSDGVLRSL